MPTYEVRFSARGDEKPFTDRRRFPTIFCEDDAAAFAEVEKIREKPYYQGREVWLVRAPSEELVDDVC